MGYFLSKKKTARQLLHKANKALNVQFVLITVCPLTLLTVAKPLYVTVNDEQI